MLALKSITRGIRKSVSYSEIGLIGVDFAIDNINLVQLGKMANGEIALRSCCSIKYVQTLEELFKSPKILRPILKQEIKEQGFKGKNIVSSMPSSDVRILSINYTKSKNSNDNESILQALGERLDDDLSEYVIDYMPVRSSEKEGEQLALVALVKHDLVISYLELFRYSGLNVQALEIRPAAIKRLIYSTNGMQNDKNVLIINFGSDKSYLTITSGRRLLFDQKFNFGADTVIEKMSNVLDMPKDSTLDLINKHGFESGNDSASSHIAYSDEDITKTLLDIARPIFDELIEEINRVLIFAASENHGDSITKIFLLGSLAHWKGIDKFLNNKLKISVEALKDPLALYDGHISGYGSESVSTPDMAIATGLALKGLIDHG